MATPTLFAIHSSYQYAENYNTDSVDGQPPHWKMKGEATRTSDLFNLEQLQAFSLDEKEAIVAAMAPESHEWADYSAGNWEILTLDAALVERVRTHCAEFEDDLGYCRYAFEGTEFEFDWAVRQESEIVKGISDYDNTHYHIFKEVAA